MSDELRAGDILYLAHEEGDVLVHVDDTDYLWDNWTWTKITVLANLSGSPHNGVGETWLGDFKRGICLNR